MVRYCDRCGKKLDKKYWNSPLILFFCDDCCDKIDEENEKFDEERIKKKLNGS